MQRRPIKPSEDSAVSITHATPVLRSSELKKRRASRSTASVQTFPWQSRYSEPYKCPELKDTPGIPESRMRAFTLPSRVGNRLHYPDGTIKELPQ
ncbi:hypothetical protein [Comamonas testosteroni]|uniref:hypothetical protein n=1 Tax=Comamonas testosteroni TaxID=285 RepID=UPI001E3FFC2C|nr:hypothetical protein [Comamonas testosteroni]